jgi:hypothetical protein
VIVVDLDHRLDRGDLTFTFTEALLDNKTATLAKGHEAVCLFVNDICDATVLEHLHELGVVGLVKVGQVKSFAAGLFLFWVWHQQVLADLSSSE